MTNIKLAFVVDSLELPAVKNRLIPLIEEGLSRKYQITIISPTDVDRSLIKGDVNFVSLKINTNNTRNHIIRALKEAYSSYRLIQLAYSSNYDYLVLSVPSIFNLLLAKRFDKFLILDIRDIVWEYMNKKNIFQRISKIIFTNIAKRKINLFNLIICTNNSEYSYLQKFKRINNIEMIIMPNGIGKRQFQDIESIKGLHYINKNNIEISYIGNFGLAQKLDTIVIAASKLPFVNFNLVGYGRDYYRIESMVRKLELKNVTLTKRLQWEEILNIYKKTDILYAQLNPLFSKALPSKLFEYLATGKFIIYGGQGTAKDFLKSFNNNKIIEPEKPSQLIKSIKEIISENRFREISNYNIDIISSKYIREDTVRQFYKRLNSINE